MRKVSVDHPASQEKAFLDSSSRKQLLSVKMRASGAKKRASEANDANPLSKVTLRQASAGYGGLESKISVPSIMTLLPRCDVIIPGVLGGQRSCSFIPL